MKNRKVSQFIGKMSQFVRKKSIYLFISVLDIVSECSRSEAGVLFENTVEVFTVVEARIESDTVERSILKI